MALLPDDNTLVAILDLLSLKRPATVEQILALGPFLSREAILAREAAVSRAWLDGYLCRDGDYYAVSKSGLDLVATYVPF